MTKLPATMSPPNIDLRELSRVICAEELREMIALLKEAHRAILGGPDAGLQSRIRAAIAKAEGKVKP